MVTANLLIRELRFEQNLIDAPRDGTFSYRRLCEKRKPATTLVRFQNNTYGSTTSSFVENTLTQLRKVAGDRQVEIIAQSHPWLAMECKETMTPKVAWGYAIAWDLVEVARELKVAADEVSRKFTWVGTWRNMLSARLDDQELLLRAHLGRQTCDEALRRHLSSAGQLHDLPPSRSRRSCAHVQGQVLQKRHGYLLLPGLDRVLDSAQP